MDSIHPVLKTLSRFICKDCANIVLEYCVCDAQKLEELCELLQLYFTQYPFNVMFIRNNDDIVEELEIRVDCDENEDYTVIRVTELSEVHQSILEASCIYTLLENIELFNDSEILGIVKQVIYVDYEYQMLSVNEFKLHEILRKHILARAQFLPFIRSEQDMVEYSQKVYQI